MKYSSELIKGSTKNLILAVLNHEELYGYQVVKAISAHSNALLEFGEGSIYPALHSLEQAGYLTSRWVKQDNLPDRKYYRLTKKGERSLKTNLAEWSEFSNAVNQVFKGTGAMKQWYV
jgi:DNA-binding PadR family transcriptional regulator